MSLDFDCIIHTNKFNHLPAQVCKQALDRANPGVNVYLEFLEDYPLLMSKNLQEFRRTNTRCRLSVDKSQSFFMVRFLATEKYLLNMNGVGKRWVLIIDPDIFCLKPITELNEYIRLAEQNGKSIIACRKQGGEFNSSLMLVNLESIVWREGEFVDNIFNKMENLDNYMFLRKQTNQILELPGNWNEYDMIRPNSYFLHTTHTITQPWKEGIELNESDLHNNFSLETGRVITYQRHPNSTVRFFIHRLFNDTYQSRYFTENDVRLSASLNQIQHNQITL